MISLRNFILHNLKSSFAIGQYEIPLLIFLFLNSIVILSEIMRKVLVFCVVLEVVRVVNMLHAYSIFEWLLYIPFLRLFNNRCAIWVYFNLVYMNSVAQSLLTCHNLGAPSAWRTVSNIAFHCIFTSLFSVKYRIRDFLNLQKLCLLHHFGPLCFVIDCQIDLQQMLKGVCFIIC
jgi:hypothetical protein